MKAIAIVCLLLSALFIAPPVSAQSAEEQFTKAQKAFEEGRYSEALPLFQAAFAETNSPNAHLYIARTLAKLGKNAEAYEEMKTTVRDATELAERESRYAETRDAAAAELALLEPKVGKLVVALADENLHPTITVNGEPFTNIGVPTAVEPGSVVVKATVDGMEPLEKLVEVGAGTNRTVTLTFKPAAGGDGGDGDTGPEEPDEKSGDFGAVRAAGIAVTILGVGGLVTFAATGAAARSKFSQLEEECVVRCTDAAYEEVVDDGKKLELVANVMAGVGAGLLAAGVLMIVFGGPDEKESAVWPALEVGPASATIGVGARF